VTGDFGTYFAGVEYWYVNQDAVSLIGSGINLQASAIDENGYRPPPDPGYFHERSGPVVPIAGHAGYDVDQSTVN
jgi:hypothetical protein